MGIMVSEVYEELIDAGASPAILWRGSSVRDSDTLLTRGLSHQPKVMEIGDIRSLKTNVGRDCVC